MTYNTAIFTVIDSLYSKTPCELNDEDKKTVSLYMVQRWLSMKSPTLTVLVNSTVNRLWKDAPFDVWYPLLMAVVPKSRVSRVQYIKKSVTVSKKPIDNEIIESIASTLEISCREVKLYIEQGWIDLKHYKKENNI